MHRADFPPLSVALAKLSIRLWSRSENYQGTAFPPEVIGVLEQRKGQLVRISPRTNGDGPYRRITIISTEER